MIYFFFNSENLVWRETIISTEVMTVPFLLLRAHLVVLKDVNWLLKSFISELQKLINLKLLKKAPSFFGLSPKLSMCCESLLPHEILKLSELWRHFCSKYRNSPVDYLMVSQLFFKRRGCSYKLFLFLKIQQNYLPCHYLDLQKPELLIRKKLVLLAIIGICSKWGGVGLGGGKY